MLALGVALFHNSGPPALGQAPVRNKVQQPSPAAVEAEILNLTNLERTRRGLQPLRQSSQLRLAALRHSANMARQNRMEHELDGAGPAERIDLTGYRWTACAENIALGYSGARTVVQGWMQSPGHRRNILNPNVTEIGVSMVLDRVGRPYYTQVFARPQADGR
jgi:uncharacterized protein YkwD